MLTFDHVGFFLRLYLEKGENIKNALSNTFIKADIKKNTEITIVTLFREIYDFLDNEKFEAIGDYLTKNHINCYGTDKLSENGGTILIQINNPQVNVYVNPEKFPLTLDKFAYKFMQNEFTFYPAAANFGTLQISVPISHIIQDETIYFCIESTGPEIIYALETNPRIAPTILEQNEPEKFYIKGNETVMVIMSKHLHKTDETKLHINVQEGCVNVMVKPQLSYFHAYQVYAQLGEGKSPFNEILTGDLVWTKLTSKNGEIIKIIPTPVQQGATFIFLENCDISNSDLISIAKINIPVVTEYELLSHEKLTIAISKKKIIKYIVPAIAPELDSVVIELLTPTLQNSKKIGKMTVNSLNIINDNFIAQQIQEIDATAGITRFEFKKSEIGVNLFIQIDAYEPFTGEIRVEQKIQISENLTEIVNNLNQPATHEGYPLTKIDNEAAYGYFTFYVSQATTMRPDILFIPNEMQNYEIKNIYLGKEKFPNNKTSDFQGKVHRISGMDIDLNSFIYLYVEAISKGDAAEQSMFSPSLPKISFTILNEEIVKRIGLGTTYRYGETGVYEVPVKPANSYIIHKKSGYSESMFVSISYGNKTPWKDKSDFSNINDEKNEGDGSVSKEVEIKIGSKDLLAKNCFRMYITVFCNNPACLYEIKVEELENPEHKTDL